MNTQQQPSLDELMAFEAGQLTEQQATLFFQRLVDTGVAWQLQEAYRKAAMLLIDQGRVHPTYH